ncbi:MAG: TonB-dependent receptor [Sulfuricurvum sp.]|nr:TonB-dependent receptor [Sulfuricurvum sp.]
MKSKFILSLASCILLQANDADQAVNLSTLSFEDLMNIEVTSTSRRAEPQHMAPGVVTVISAQEIEHYGARHLRDVLDRVVGMQILSSRQWGHAKSSIRGMNSTHNEGPVLVLLNGRPMREGTDGGVNFDIYQGFPLAIIDHIEIIRGPGSVIYGTNAMAGVINLVTKDAKTAINETRVDIGGGSFERRQLQVSSLLSGMDYAVTVGANMIRSHGDDFEGITDVDNNVGTYILDENSDNLVINGNYKDFTFNAMVMDNNANRANSRFQLPSQEVQKRRLFFDAGYLYDITNGWDASINYTLSTSSVGWQATETLGRNHYNDRSEMVELIVRGNLNEKLNLLAGGTYTENRTAFDFFLNPVKVSNYSAYVQLDYMVTPKLKIIGGSQWNKSPNISGDLSARAGVIQGIGDNWWVKLLYSEAFRSPNLVETNIRSGVNLWGNPNLSPEKVQTYDLQFIYQTPNEYLGITLYDTMHEDLIVRDGGVTPPSLYNQGFMHYQGIEIEGRIAATEDLDLMANYSYQTNKNNNGVKQSTFAPQQMAKAGANYKGFDGINIGVFNSYISAATDLTVTNNAPFKNTKPSAYNLLTANVTLDTAKTWGIGKAGHSTLALYLDNLFDETIYAADLNFGNINNSVPHHWGRNANLTYTYKF